MKIIDLFAGTGGFSKGFEMAGFETVFAVEKDEWASETFKFNHKDTRVKCGDITEIVDFEDLNIGEIEGIIGGPPCQGFSLSGKRDRKDPRNSLFMNFVRFVEHYQPKFFVMENVPGLLSMKTAKKEKVVDLILNEFSQIKYVVKYKVLNAAEYGVPQKRQRVFFIGTRCSINVDPETLFPEPILTEDQFITIDQAILDLPQITSGENAEGSKYRSSPKNGYQKEMRKNQKSVYNHTAMRHTKRLIERFKVIENGKSLKDVPMEHMQRKRGDASKVSGKVYSQNNMRPYGDRPSPTIAASFQSNYIHPQLNRNFTAREAARLQSFPDDYIFKGKRTTMSWEKNLSQYQQIGNAVPPLLAKAIGKKIISSL